MSSPLEAATHDEALTKARAKYGDDAQVGVRLARSGGVLGFFATEKYVAEVLDGPVDSSVATPAPVGHGVANGGTGLADAIADYSDLLGPPTPSTQPSIPVRPSVARALAPNDAGTYSAHATSAPFVSMVATEAFLADHAPAFAPSAPTAKTEPAAATKTPEAPADASGPTSPFAAALSRMAVEPEVAEAVAVVVEVAETEAIHTALAPTPAHVPTAATVLKPNHPIPQPDVAAAIDTIVGEAMAPHEPPTPVEAPEPFEPRLVSAPPAAPSLVAYNLAGALVTDRGTDLPVAEQHAATPPAAVAPDPIAAAVVAVPTADTQMAVMASNIRHPADPTGLLPRLGRVGFPTAQVPDLFLHEVGEKGIHTALTRLIKMRTAPAPALPVAPCTVVFVGPGTEALTAAMQACGALRADASQVAWVGPANLSSLVPSTRRISTPEGATTWLAAPKRATVVNVIAIHTPVTENVDAHTRTVIAALNPTMVLAVVDATRKAEAVTRWIEALDCVDAVALENASDTHDPATWLGLAVAPVALVEGRKATAARWSSMLCERLTDMEG